MKMGDFCLGVLVVFGWDNSFKYHIIYIPYMVKLQIDVDEDLYYKLLRLKGTKRSWVDFLREIVDGG